MSRKQRLKKQKVLAPTIEQSTDGSNFSLNTKTVVIFLAIIVSLLYINSLGNVFLSDDLSSIANNPNIGNIREVFSPPFNSIIMKLVHYVIFKFFGLAPWAFRSLNILFHIGSTIVIFLLVKKLVSERVALISAVLFGAHPILVESITWVSGGPYAQFGFLLLTSLFLYTKIQEKKWLYWISLLLFTLAAMTSSMAVVFPLVLFMYEICFGNLRKNWVRLAPFGLVSILCALGYTSSIGEEFETLETNYYTKPKLLNPLVQIPIVIIEYIKLIFWPIGLTLYHSELSFSQGNYLVRLVLFLLFLGLILYCWRRNRTMMFFLTFFPISLMVTLTPFGLTSLVAERYVYLGTFGVITVVAMILDWVIAKKNTQELGWIIFFLIVIALSVRTIVRNIDWKNEDNLWIATGKTSFSSSNAHINLGDVYARRGDYQRAIQEFGMAIAINPGYADAYHDLANTYYLMGKFDEAIKYYQEAVKYNSRLWQSYRGIASIYLQQNRSDLAIEYLEKALPVTMDKEKEKIQDAIKQLRERN